MHMLRLAPLALAAALTACGGGIDTTTDPTGPDADAADASADREAFERGKALAAFDAMVEKHKDVPATELNHTPGCVPGEPGCVQVPASGYAMAGIDLVAATVDPAATQPGGRAWLTQAAAPEGPALAGNSDTPDYDSWRNAGKEADVAPSATLANAQAGGDFTASATSFGSTVVNPMSGHNPRRLKIFYQTVDKGTTVVKNRVCSGTLVDSQWVMTNSHCLWDKEWDNNGYVRIAYVTPGYADNKAPYGRAYATKILVPEAYKTTNDGSTDVAWFQLDRPIGGLTGYDGLMYMGGTSPTPNAPNARCTEGLKRNYINQSYPSDTSFTIPGHSSPVTGHKMYQTNFRFDECLGGGSHFKLNFPIGHGASGSAAFETFNIGGGFNNINALYESSDQKTYARFVSLTPQHTGAFAASAYEGGLLTGTKPDLAVASFRITSPTKDSEPDSETSPTTAFAPNEAVSFVIWVHNNAFNADYNAPIKYRVFISLNATITSADQLISATDTRVAISVPRKRSNVIVEKTPMSCVGPKVPVSPTGEYYVGVVLDVADAYTPNNSGHGLSATAKVKLKRCS